MQPIKEKNENSDYKGDEMGDDIKNIDLSCPVANAAASKIQVYFIRILRKVQGPQTECKRSALENNMALGLKLYDLQNNTGIRKFKVYG